MHRHGKFRCLRHRYDSFIAYNLFDRPYSKKLWLTTSSWHNGDSLRGENKISYLASVLWNSHCDATNDRHATKSSQYHAVNPYTCSFCHKLITFFRSPCSNARLHRTGRCQTTIVWTTTTNQQSTRKCRLPCSAFPSRSLSKHRCFGLSGQKGKVNSWNTAGTIPIPKIYGHLVAVPRSWGSPSICDIKIANTMKNWWIPPSIPRSFSGGISVMYKGATAEVIPETKTLIMSVDTSGTLQNDHFEHPCDMVRFC